MDLASISFKLLAALHALAGLIVLGLALDIDVQDDCIYPEGETAAGHVRMHFVVVMSYAMIFGGIAGLFWPIPALLLIWGSVATYFLSGLIDPIATRTWPRLCLRCTLALLARVLPALAMTLLYVYVIQGGV